ncbi:MAG: hypothetical protein M3Y91_06675 [Actinomycetota bacterium]|nr:hypothetical protein [Actinomycetota bacterium]
MDEMNFAGARLAIPANPVKGLECVAELEADPKKDGRAALLEVDTFTELHWLEYQRIGTPFPPLLKALLALFGA